MNKISSALKQKIAVICKNYYVIRTIDDLFIFSGCEKSWWVNSPIEHGSDRMNKVFGWFEGISKNAPEKEFEIAKSICEFIITNNEIPKNDKEQVEIFLKRENVPLQTDTLIPYNLHPKVIEIAMALFKNGHYRQAILDTYIALVEEVKIKSGRSDIDNSPLMQTVFSQNNPILKISDDKDEQLGFMWLFSGAVMAIRNPKAHRLIEQKDPHRTIEWLVFASALFKILEESERIYKSNEDFFNDLIKALNRDDLKIFKNKCLLIPVKYCNVEDVHYEFWFHKNLLECGLHFEGNKENNKELYDKIKIHIKDKRLGEGLEYPREKAESKTIATFLQYPEMSSKTIKWGLTQLKNLQKICDPLLEDYFTARQKT